MDMRVKRQVRDSNVLVDRKNNIGKETIKENLLKRGMCKYLTKKFIEKGGLCKYLSGKLLEN